MKMRIDILAGAFSLLLISCGSNEDEKKNEPAPKADTSSSENSDTPRSKEYVITPLSIGEYYAPIKTDYDPKSSGKITVTNDKNLNFKIVCYYENGAKDELTFSGEKLIAKVSPITWNHVYHQQLSVYLSEKQWCRDSVMGVIANTGISRYEIINPPFGKHWYLNALAKNGNEETVIASYKIEVPDEIYTSLFKKINPQADPNLLTYRFTAPEPKKIEYNSLRKLGKFYEGLLGDMNTLPLELPEVFSNHLYLQKNKITSLAQLYEGDLKFPEHKDNGYDTTNSTTLSLSDLQFIKAFSYKTAYPINGDKDSTIELQIDFKTKNNSATIRFVMGGIDLAVLPKLKSSDIANGMFFPLGFHTYKGKTKMQESYLMMGNTSGLWVDNTYGKNMDGIILYLDKSQKSKIHIWLMGGDGTLPIAHYVALLDKVIK